MILGRQIYSLLKRHTAVFVKGLGAFKRVRTSASFDAKRNVVLPPLSYIEFEHDVQEGYDFTLYVQQSNQLERVEAEKIIQKEVENLLDIINRDGQVTLDELGQLVSYGHSFIFKPFDLSGFQFVAVEDPYTKPNQLSEEENTIEDEIISPDLEVGKEINTQEYIPTAKEPPHVDNSGSLEEVESSAANTQYLAEETNFQHQEDYEENVPKRSNGIVYALIAVVALLAVGGIYYYSIISKKLDNVDQFLNTFDNTENETDSLGNITESTLLDSASLALIDSAELATNDSLSTLHDIVKEQNKEEIIHHKYTIVIGTHKTFDQAKAEEAEFHRKGFKHVRALPSNLEKNRKKVIWDTYATKEQRDSALHYVQKNVNAEAWPTTVN